MVVLEYFQMLPGNPELCPRGGEGDSSGAWLAEPLPARFGGFMTHWERAWCCLPEPLTARAPVLLQTEEHGHLLPGVRVGTPEG